MRRVLVVGGGASGLMAAIAAARAGAQVTVLEQNERPAKKLCATGNGRCNLTNSDQNPQAYRGTHPEFCKSALAQLDVAATLRLFAELGIETVNKNGYIYPRCEQAQAVAEVLCMEAAARKVKIKNNEKVVSLAKKEEAPCWQVTTQTWTYEAEAVILAGGSRASGIAGADGSCYDLAAALGHRLVTPLPALTGLKCKGSFFGKWVGVRTHGRVTAYIEDKPQETQVGELQLTEYGVSGIPVFQVSRAVIRALAEGKKAALCLDFLPEYGRKEAEELLDVRRERCPYKTDRQLLVGLFPDKLIAVLCDLAKKRGTALAHVCKNLHMEVTGGLPFARAQVCSGGVDTAQVNPDTMESRLHRGLYFAGELLDIDGMCGGYNLQWAWSSGACAGRHAAEDGI